MLTAIVKQMGLNRVLGPTALPESEEYFSNGVSCR